MNYTPDKWVVIKICLLEETVYKVFACWYGGYLGSNSWKLNSGITKVESGGNFWNFEGSSGSVYRCHKDTYGTHMYGQGVLDSIIERSKESGINVEILENTDWEKINYG